MANSSLAANADTLKVKGANDEVVSNYYTYIEDKACSLNIDTVLALYKNNQFINKFKGKSVFNSLFTKSCYWFVMPVKNDTSTANDFLWSFYNNNLYLTLFDITNAKQPKFIEKILCSQPLSKRYQQFRMPTFYVHMNAGEYKLLLVKVEKQNIDFIYFPSDFTTVNDLLKWEVDYYLIVGIYTGLFLFVLFTNIFLWIYLKARIHLWHACYVLMIILYSLAENMFDIKLLPEFIYPYFNVLPKMFFLGMALFFGIKVFQIFIRQNRFPNYFKITNYFKNLIVIASLLLFVSSFLLPFSSAALSFIRIVVDVLFFAGTIFTFGLIILGSIRKDSATLGYLMASSFLMLAYIDYICVELFNFHVYYFRPGNILIGFGIEIIFLTYLFIVRVSKEKQQNYLLLKEKSSENEKLMKDMLTTQENERNRIARDLHDDLGATLSTLKLLLSNSDVSDKEKLMSIASKATQDLRTLAHNLIPKDFLKRGFFNTLKEMEETLNKQSDTKFNFILIGDDTFLNEDVTVTLYRILSECTNNILKHAMSSEASVQVMIEEAAIQIIVEDNGIGFNLKNKTNGIGLENINKRVAYLKGETFIDSSKNGTTIIIEAPLKKTTLYE